MTIKKNRHRNDDGFSLFRLFDVQDGVSWRIVVADFEMQVWACGASAGADVGNYIARFYLLPGGHFNIRL